MGGRATPHDHLQDEGQGFLRPVFSAIIAIKFRCDRPIGPALGSRIVVLEHEPTDHEVAASSDIWPPKASWTSPPMNERKWRSSPFQNPPVRPAARPSAFDEGMAGLSAVQARAVADDMARSDPHQSAKDRQGALRRRSKQEDLELQRRKVREAVQQHPNDRHAQIEATGLKSSTFYNRLKEIQTEPQAA